MLKARNLKMSKEYWRVKYMKKDIFNGNIKKEYIRYVKYSLIFASILWFIFFLFFLFFGVLYEKIEFAARIFMFVFSGISLILSIIYPILSVYSIKNFDKHPKLAKALIKEFVFETNESRIINTLKEGVILTAKDFPVSWELTTNNILSYIPSQEIRHYLLKNKEKITLMQYATLIESYYKGNMVAIFEVLRDFSKNDYEKELFNIAAKDYRKYKYLTDRTFNYYLENDPRANKPNCAFAEYIDLPIIFKEYNLALYKSGKYEKVVLITHLPNLNNVENDFSDLSYCAYDLIEISDISEEELFKIHCHPHICELDRIEEKHLSKQQLKSLNVILDFIRNQK